MDKGKLLTIVVTAVISATITTMVKSLLDFIKWPPIASRLKQTAKNTFTKNVITLTTESFMFLLQIWILVVFIRDSRPITRFDVFLMMATFLGVLMWLIALVFSSTLIILEKERTSGEDN